MEHFLLNLFAAMGLAYGITALTTLRVRSERFMKMVAWTFVWSLLVIFLFLLWARLPAEAVRSLGVAGAVIGLLCTLGLKIARTIERRAGID